MRSMKAAIFWIVVLVSAFLLWQVVRAAPANRNTPEVSYSRFMSQVSNGQVSRVTISGREIRGLDDKGASFRVIAPPDQSAMIAALQQHGIEIWFRDSSAQDWPNWILNLAPLILLAALWFFMIRQMQMRSRKSGAGSEFSTPSGSAPSQSRFGP